MENTQNPVVLEKIYYILNKRIYISKVERKSTKITYFEPDSYIKSQKDDRFEGVITRDLYCHLDFFNKVGVGYFKFIFGEPFFGHELQLIDILPIENK